MRQGGYGSVRIVDQLDFTAFIRHPKWVIGFSDITLLHSHIHRHCKVATLHSKCAIVSAGLVAGRCPTTG